MLASRFMSIFKNDIPFTVELYLGVKIVSFGVR